MTIAILSDTHGNYQALEAVITDAQRRGANRFWFLGDAVDYGARNEECVAKLAEITEIALAGNHDLSIVGKISRGHFRNDLLKTMDWVYNQLSPESVAWLEALPPETHRRDMGFYHGAPSDPVWAYIEDRYDAKACFQTTPYRLIFVGHLHAQFAFTDNPAHPQAFCTEEDESELLIHLGEGRRWVINPGSVGQPRDHDWRAAYALLDLSANILSFHRVEYPVEEVVTEILASPMDDYFAERLLPEAFK